MLIEKCTKGTVLKEIFCHVIAVEPVQTRRTKLSSHMLGQYSKKVMESIMVRYMMISCMMVETVTISECYRRNDYISKDRLSRIWTI